MIEEAGQRSTCSTADLTNSSGRKEQILVKSGHSSFPLSLLPIHLHDGASFLKVIDALCHVLWYHCGQFSARVSHLLMFNIAFLQISLQGVLKSLLLLTSKVVTIGELGV